MASTNDHPFPHTLEFSFSEALPAESEVAQFVVSLAAAANDLILIHKLWFTVNEADLHPSRELDEGESLYMLRQSLSIVWEAHLLLEAAYNRPDTARFLGSLSAEAAQARTNLEQAIEALSSGPYRGVVQQARNITWHFPKPGGPAKGKSLAPALEALAEDKAIGSIVQSGPSDGQIRFLFADLVLLNMAFKKIKSDSAFAAFVREVARPALSATIALAQHVVFEYFEMSPTADAGVSAQRVQS